MELGKLVKWNDTKGFGFIELENKEGNVFIHISTLKHMSRKPKVGDLIYFEIKKKQDGKLCAENCRIQGAKTKHTRQINDKKNKSYAHQRSLKPRILLFIVMGILYLTFTKNILKSTISDLSNSPTNKVKVVPLEKVAPLFKCEGKKYCSQMMSCDEAKFYIQNCPNTKMDGDHDGVPCEKQHCGSGFW